MSDRPVYITDVTAFLPGAPIGNDDMERLLGQVGERASRARRTILRSNGITGRHYAVDPETLAPTHNNAQLTAEAVRKLDGGRISLTDIDCLACGTSLPDQMLPSHASMVQGELGLPHLEAVATSGVCASSMAALKYGYMAVRSGLHTNAVATGSDRSSAIMQARQFNGELEAAAEQLESRPELAFEKDFLRWMLSDGAGAVLLEGQPATDGLSLEIDWLEMLSYAGEMEACMYAGAEKLADGSLRGWQDYDADALGAHSIMAIKQDVKLLNENIVRYTVEKPLEDICARHAFTADDIDWFLPHYSSEFFRGKLAAGLAAVGLDIPMERWFTNLTYRGNTGAASMFLMLEELFHSGKLKPGQRLLCYVPESGRFSTAFLHLTVR